MNFKEFKHDILKLTLIFTPNRSILVFNYSYDYREPIQNRQKQNCPLLILPK